MRFHPVLPHGFSKSALRTRRSRHKWDGLVQIHHLVPRSLRDHPTLALFEYDVHAEYNLILMPTREGRDKLELRSRRPAHDGGHMSYNHFVAGGLDSCRTSVDFVLLLMLLHRGCRGLVSIPWRR